MVCLHQSLAYFACQCSVTRISFKRRLINLDGFLRLNSKTKMTQACLPLKAKQTNKRQQHSINPLTAAGVLRELIDFTLSNARRFYLSMGNPLAVKEVLTSSTQLQITSFHVVGVRTGPGRLRNVRK